MQNCPLTLPSPNARQEIDVLRPLILSIVSGHHRFPPIATIRARLVDPALTGMKKVYRENAVRWALGAPSMRVPEPSGCRLISCGATNRC